MPDSLYQIIVSLKQSPAIQNNHRLCDYLTAINKYCLDDRHKAYFLGLFFKHQMAIASIEPKIRRAVLEYIRINDLSDYFNEGKRYRDIMFGIFLLFMVAAGIMFLIWGLKGITTNRVTPSFGFSRLGTMADTALGKIFVGVVFLAGVIWTWSYSYNREKLERELLSAES